MPVAGWERVMSVAIGISEGDGDDRVLLVVGLSNATVTAAFARVLATGLIQLAELVDGRVTDDSGAKPS